MLLPLRDNLPTRSAPVVTVALILACFAIFVYEQTRPAALLPAVPSGTPVPVSGFDAFTARWGFVPCELTERCAQPGVSPLPLADGRCCVPVAVPEEPVYVTLLTSIFLHGSWLHLLGNMLFLWIFGNNIEDAMGRLRFLVFYLVCGVLASLAQLVVNPDSNVPTIGASGAIAGVLGGYLLLHPRARVLTAVVLIFLFPIFEIPAWVVLVVWFGFQILEGSSAAVGSDGGGVAYWAHVGGFVAGLLLVSFFVRRGVRPAGRWAG